MTWFGVFSIVQQRVNHGTMIWVGIGPRYWFQETSTYDNRECRDRFTRSTCVFGSRLGPFALVIFAFTNSKVFAKSTYSSPVPETLNSMGPVSVMLLRGCYSIHWPLVIDVCVAGIVKRSSSDFVHSWLRFVMNKTHFTSRRNICLRVFLAGEMFFISCLEANCFFLVVLSFLYFFLPAPDCGQFREGRLRACLARLFVAVLRLSPANTSCPILGNTNTRLNSFFLSSILAPCWRWGTAQRKRLLAEIEHREKLVNSHLFAWLALSSTVRTTCDLGCEASSSFQKFTGLLCRKWSVSNTLPNSNGTVSLVSRFILTVILSNCFMLTGTYCGRTKDLLTRCQSFPSTGTIRSMGTSASPTYCGWIISQ